MATRSTRTPSPARGATPTATTLWEIRPRAPDGATVSYTPFDLPSTITQSTGTVTLAYDGDQQRIRKTTPTAETLYFGDLFEQVTTVAPASTAYAYYVHSPERVVAVVTVGGPQAGTAYVHVDHLGSVDALTDVNGAVLEHRSYDAFGQRRNPVWGQTDAGHASRPRRRWASPARRATTSSGS